MATGFEDLGVQVINQSKKKAEDGFEDLGVKIVKPSSSAAGAFGRGALESALPTVASLGAMGLATAATVGGALIPITAGLLAGVGASKAQDIAGKKLFPEQRERFLRQLHEDVEEHPVASLLGQFAPSAIALRPGIPRTLQQAKISLGSGAIQAGLETGTELARGEKLSPTRIATAGGIGLTLPRPTAVGRKLGFPSEPVKATGVLNDSVLTPESKNRIQRITEALREAKPIRGQQEALFTKARAQKMARAMSIRERVSGESGFKAELGQLKGELPKLQFESLRAPGRIDKITGLPLNPDNTVTVYHHTNKLSADAVRRTGVLRSRGEPSVYVTTERNPVTGYGDTVVPIKIRPSKLLIDDEFPTGRKDFRIDASKSGQGIKVDVLENMPQIKLDQSDIDGLMDDVNQNLDFWDSLPAREGILKMLDGQVPTEGEIHLLNRVFGSELTRELARKRTFLMKARNLGVELFNLPRSFMAGIGDFSASLRQGVFLAPRHPILWSKAFAGQFRKFASEKVFQESERQIRQRPTYNLMSQHGLDLTDVGGPIGEREERFMSSLAERIPGIGRVVRATNRAYVGFLNRLRADVFDDFVKAGRDVGLQEDSTHLRSAAEWVNNATGRGTLRIPVVGGLEGSEVLKRSAVLLNSTLFSPRLLFSRLNILDPTFYVRLHPQVRKEAIKSLFAFAGTGATVVGFMRLGGAKVGVDPRNADFGKGRWGNTRFDIFGGFQQPIRAAAQMISGTQISSVTGREITLGEGYKPTTRLDILQRFFESKESPVVSLLVSLMRGRTSVGEEVRIVPEVINRFIPMVLSDIYDVSQEEGAGSWWKALPSLFGVGVQTYGSQIPLIEKIASGQPTVKFRQEPSLGEAIFNKATGERISGIPEQFHPGLKRAKEFQLMRQIEIDKAKQLVLKTGRPRRVMNTLVYLQNGVVKTRGFGGESQITPENVLQLKLRRREKELLSR